MGKYIQSVIVPFDNSNETSLYNGMPWSNRDIIEDGDKKRKGEFDGNRFCN